MQGDHPRVEALLAHFSGLDVSGPQLGRGELLPLSVYGFPSDICRAMRVSPKGSTTVSGLKKKARGLPQGSFL